MSSCNQDEKLLPVRSSSRSSASPEPPPTYEEVCSKFWQNESNGTCDRDSLDDEDIHSDIAVLGIQFPSQVDIDDDVCLIGENTGEYRSHGPFRNRLPSVEAIPAERPPKFTREPVLFDTFTTCKVCLENFKVSGRLNQSVVKCSYCGEATPIKDPPAGKKFIRCPCNCLLVAKVSAMRIACPRPECKKIINLHTNRTALGRDSSSGQRLSCGHCAETFVVNISRRSGYAQCPHCREFSSIGPIYKRRKILIYFVLCTVLGIAAFVFFVVWYNKFRHQELFCIVGALFFLAFLFSLFKLIVFIRWRVSAIIESNIPEPVAPSAIPGDNSNDFFSGNMRRLSQLRRSITSLSGQHRGRSNSEIPTSSSLTLPVNETETV